MTLDRKLVLLATLPLAFALIPATLLVLRAERSVREMRGLNALSSLVWKMSDVEKRFDEEADNWYMFRQEHVNDPADVLAAARKRQDAARVATDAALADYDQALAGLKGMDLPESIERILETVATERTKLASVRQLLYTRHTDAQSAEIAQYYLEMRNRLGSVLMLLIDETTNDVVARKLQVLAKTIALRKNGMDAGRKIFWAIQVWNSEKRPIPAEHSTAIARSAELADSQWNDMIALSQGETRARILAFEQDGKWKQPIAIMRQTADNLALRQPPSLTDEPKWKVMYDFIDLTLGEHVAWLRQDFNATCAEIDRQLVRERNLTIGLSVLGIAGLMFLNRRMARSISLPLKKTAKQLAEAARTFAAQASELARASMTLSQGASEQAASIEETSASLEQLTASTQQNEETATHAVDSTHRAATSAADGREMIATLTKTVSEVETSGSAISRILKSIDEIAFQTNILALNAAVEAARAGESGAGFAVVADEVRNLARRSTEAARETTELLVGGMSVNGEHRAGVVEGLARIRDDCQRVSTRFDEIASKIQETDTQAAQIAKASGEQSRGLSVIADAIHKIDQVTQDNAASSEQAAATAEGLMAHAEELRKTVQMLEKTLGVSTSTDGALEEPELKEAPAAAEPAAAPAPEAEPETPRGKSRRAESAVGYPRH